MIFLHVPYLHHREFSYFEEQTNGLQSLVVTIVLSVVICLALLAIGSWFGRLLKQQTEQYMKFIFQLYPGMKANETPSLVEQTEEQAIEQAKELSTFYDKLVIVRHPETKQIVCIAEKGELQPVNGSFIVAR